MNDFVFNRDIVVGFAVLAFLFTLLAIQLRSMRRSREHLEDKPTTSGVVLRSVWITDGLPAITVVADTGRRPGDAKQRLEFNLHSHDFFKKTSGDGKEGHFVVMMRADTAALTTGMYRGHGPIFGTIYPDPAVEPPLGHLRMESQGCLEDWQVGMAPPGWPALIPASLTPTLRDGVDYRVVIESEPTVSGWMLCLRVGSFDSGVLFSDNCNIDPTSEAVAFAVVGSTGSLQVTNILSTWSA